MYSKYLNNPLKEIIVALKIKKLSKELKDDYLHFFDDIAFCDNPAWSECYCTHFYYADGDNLDNITRKETRACVTDRMNNGKHNGFIAYLDNKPVGWVNADSKENYSRIIKNEEIDYDKEKKVGSIVCFVVDHNHRGKGIAKALLVEACRYLKENGYDCVESYPLKSPENDAENYHGPLKMYFDKGFVVTKELNNLSVVTKDFK
jgi:ribosomal protein S18 acetylase RimI-like enzyme